MSEVSQVILDGLPYKKHDVNNTYLTHQPTILFMLWPTMVVTQVVLKIFIQIHPVEVVEVLLLV